MRSKVWNMSRLSCCIVASGHKYFIKARIDSFSVSVDNGNGLKQFDDLWLSVKIENDPYPRAQRNCMVHMQYFGSAGEFRFGSETVPSGHLTNLFFYLSINYYHSLFLCISVINCCFQISCTCLKSIATSIVQFFSNVFVCVMAYYEERWSCGQCNQMCIFDNTNKNIKHNTFARWVRYWFICNESLYTVETVCNEWEWVFTKSTIRWRE